MKKATVLHILVIFFLHSNSQQLYEVKNGNISFTSDAALEIIEAESNDLKGLLKIDDRTFAFRVAMISFEGFNSSLQRTHFNENYLESAKFPYTIFEGKIIEEVDLSSPGTHLIRGKGKFTCHGVEQERIVKCKINITSDKIKIISQFTVFLEDHNIKIPSVVNQKIAEEILVKIDIELIPQK